MAKTRTKTFVFEGPAGGMKISLEGKSETMGRHEIDQWWIPLPKLKPTKAGKGGTYRTICDAYPVICTDAYARKGADPGDWTGAAGTHVLARLLPYARSRGALNVFNDAKESRNAHRGLRSTTSWNCC